MQMLANMNAKLNLGWKLTNLSCSKCSGSTLAESASKIDQLYCPKCDQMVPLPEKIEEDIDSDKQMDEINGFDEQAEFYSQVFKEAEEKKQSHVVDKDKYLEHHDRYQESYNKTNEVSKKIGQKLLQGWTMLEQSCYDCNAPLMRSKKGQKICCGCNKDYAEIERQQKDKEEKAKKEKSSKVENAPSKLKLVEKISEKPHSESLSESSELINLMEVKTLKYLDKKLDKAIEGNEWSQIEKIIHLLQQIKNSPQPSH